jgi:hypothetical protein
MDKTFLSPSLKNNVISGFAPVYHSPRGAMFPTSPSEF